MGKRAKKQVEKTEWSEGNESLLQQEMQKKRDFEMLLTTPDCEIEKKYVNAKDIIKKKNEILRMREETNKKIFEQTRIWNFKKIGEIVNPKYRWLETQAIKFGYSPHDINFLRIANKYAPKVINTQIRYDFESKLIDAQIIELLPVANNKIFVEEQTVESIKLFLACKHNQPLMVKKNWAIAYFLHLLSYHGFICQNYQKVASEMKVFKSIKGKTLVRQDFSKALATKRKNASAILDTDIFNIITDLKR